MKSLLSFYALCKISAADFAIACWYADRAEVPGALFATYARPPGLQPGKYQSYLDGVLPSAGPYYMVSTPCSAKASAARLTRSIPIAPCHDSIHAEVASNANILGQLHGDGPDICRTVAYETHPHVAAARLNGDPRPLPLALYLDGVRFTPPQAGRSDSVLGIWVINLLTNIRLALVFVCCCVRGCCVQHCMHCFTAQVAEGAQQPCNSFVYAWLLCQASCRFAAGPRFLQMRLQRVVHAVSHPARVGVAIWWSRGGSSASFAP